MFLSILLGTLSHCIYVNISGTDQPDCGPRAQPCRSLSYTINNVSRPNDEICLIASAIKQIKYSLEIHIVIKHNLTVTKCPLLSVNPVIIYRVNVISKWKEFYAFTSFRSTVGAAEMLSLKIKSVNFNVNIFTDFSEGCKTIGRNMLNNVSDCRLFLSISDSIISSPGHAVNLSDLLGYENVFIYVKDSVIQSGRFIFKNKRESCKPTEDVKNIVEMNNVTVLNTGIAALNFNGCFNISFNKFICSNVTWKKQELFTFRGSSLKMKTIIIENILPNNNKSEGKTLFLIHRCAVEIENMLIKNSKLTSSMQLHEALSVLFVENSLLKMRNLEIVGNVLQNFVWVENSFLSINNISLSYNIFTGTLYSFGKSNIKLCDAAFHSNKVGSFIRINRNSNAVITNNIISGNEIYKNAYSIANSIIQLKNITLIKNNVMKDLLYLTSSSSAFIQKKTLTENNVSGNVYYLYKMSNMQLNNEAFTRNNLMKYLLEMVLNSSAMIQNKTFIENNVSRTVYKLQRERVMSN